MNIAVSEERPSTDLGQRTVPTDSNNVAETLDIWFITDMVLCNFECAYCCAYSVVTTEKTWHTEDSYERFLQVTERLSQVPYQLRMRVQTLGEPFVSREFLERAGWLTSHDNIDFVELVTNGSLFKQRLKYITESGGDLNKLSLWVTFHHTEIGMEKFLEQAEYAQDSGAFVVVNALAFPDSIAIVEELHKECGERGLRMNVDPGYRDGGGEYDKGPLIAMMSEPDGIERLNKLTANKNVLAANLHAARSPDGEMCSAGGDYFIILNDGSVGPCCPLLSKGINLGNILDANFELKPGKKKYSPCTVDRRTPVISSLPIIGDKFRTPWPCKNKEDFSHLKVIRENEPHSRSFGWFGD